MGKKEYIISITLISILFVIMLFTFYQNISLKMKRNELNKYLEEYHILKEEINTLTEINDNYEITIKNNEELEIKKTKLENQITEINNKINNLTKEIDKLK